MERCFGGRSIIMFYVIIIVIFVLWLFVCIVFYFSWKNTKTTRISFQRHSQIEIIWTTIPTVILLLIGSTIFWFIIWVEFFTWSKNNFKIYRNTNAIERMNIAITLL